MTKSSGFRIVPPTRLLVTGRQESRRRLFAHRPEGADEWILICIEGGWSYFRSGGAEVEGVAGDVMLIRPGTPHDYGLDERRGYWKNTWTHFLPRAECVKWLQWPEIAPGLMRLRLDKQMHRQVCEELHRMDAESHSEGRRSEEFAVNALERALLLCDGQNPRDAGSRQDARIRKAVELLCAHPERRFTVEGLARQCGLSRSRFAELFREQAGATPLVFLENQRLRRARELIEHTSLRVGEIAEQAGFASAFYFSLRFKRQFGVSPAIYRKKK